MADTDNRGPQLQAVAYLLVVLAFVTYMLRAYTRVFLVKSFGFDDGCMFIALVFFVLFVTCALVGVEHGTGRHWWVLPEEGRMTAMRYWFYCYMWYALSMIASKVSISFFLLRITIRRRDIWIIYSAMAVTVITGMVFFFVTLFQCKPISFFWDKRSGNGSCLDMDIIIALTYLYSACSVICDFTFALLPLVLIYHLNMDKKSKIALAPIVVMACVASAAVVVRFNYVKDFKNPDFLFATVDIAIWSCTEQGLAVTAGSLATLRPLFRSLGSRMGTRASQNPSNGTAGAAAALGASNRSRRENKHNNSRSMILLTEMGPEKEFDGFHDNGSTIGRGPHANSDEIWDTRGRQGSEEQLTGVMPHPPPETKKGLSRADDRV